jgi:hypothetical protein
MTAVLPHYKPGGPANYQAATLIYGGQLVQPNTLTAGTTDLTVTQALSGSVNVLGVAGTDANVVLTQTGAANSYGEPLIDISVLTDYVPVYYGGIDIWVWYTNQNAVPPGARLIIGGTAGCVTVAGSTPDARTVVGVCTHPGGVSTAMCTQQIGGQGAATFFLGRARITV